MYTSHTYDIFENVVQEKPIRDLRHIETICDVQAGIYIQVISTVNFEGTSSEW